MYKKKSFLFKRVPFSVIKEMLDILARIKSGELNHQQRNWHCGTAHCFGGWKLMLDAKNRIEDFEPIGQNAMRIRGGWDDIIFSVFGFSMDDGIALHYYLAAQWKLSIMEVSLLTNQNNTFDDLVAFVKRIRQGYRLVGEPYDFVWVKASALSTHSELVEVTAQNYMDLRETLGACPLRSISDFERKDLLND